MIVVRTPDGVLNSIGCERHEVIRSIRDSFEIFKIEQSHWGVLCSPLIAIPAMALLNGAYDYVLQILRNQHVLFGDGQ